MSLKVHNAASRIRTRNVPFRSPVKSREPSAIRQWRRQDKISTPRLYTSLIIITLLLFNNIPYVIVRFNRYLDEFHPLYG